VDREISRLEIGHCLVFRPPQRAAGAAFAPTTRTTYSNIGTSDSGINPLQTLLINNITVNMSTNLQDIPSPSQAEQDEYSIPDEDLRSDASSHKTREESEEITTMDDDHNWMFQDTVKNKG
jgi:hypothetical protein